MCAFNDFNLVDISGIVVSIFEFRFLMSNDNKWEGFSNLNCFSIISKSKSLFGSKLIGVGDFGKDTKLSDSVTSSPSAFFETFLSSSSTPGSLSPLVNRL
jgi:hypothetical protein